MRLPTDDSCLANQTGAAVGPDFAMICLRRIHSQAGYLRQPLHSILMGAEQIRDLLIQLANLLLEECQFPQGPSSAAAGKQVEARCRRPARRTTAPPWLASPLSPMAASKSCRVGFPIGEALASYAVR